MRRILPLVVVAALASGLTAAAIAGPGFAGGRDDSGSAEAVDREQAVEQFRACMREQGFTLGPDTELRVTPDGATLNGEPVDSERLRNALRECRAELREELGPALGRGALDPEARERMERVRECLQEERV